MNRYSLTHLGDQALLAHLDALDARDQGTTAELLAHLAEVDERKLYVPMGYDCMKEYCIHERHYSDDEAFKRIRAARTAWRFPVLFEALAEGRLHVTAVVMLTPHLTPENAVELLAAASHKSKAEIQLLLAHRFPKPDLPARFDASSAPSATPSAGPLVPEPVGAGVGSLVPEPVESPGPRAKMAPLSPDRFGLQCTLPGSTHEKIQYAEALMDHQVRPGDIVTLIDLAFGALIEKRER